MNTLAASLATYPAPARLGLFVVMLLVVWLPIALPIYRSLPPVWADIIAPVLLYGEFLALVHGWGRWVYQEPRLFRRYGLVRTWAMLRLGFQGLAIGLSNLFAMFVIQSLLGWVVWQALPPNFLRIAIEGGLVAIAIGCAEEILFRGWLLGELERDYRPATALGATSLIFAVLHFIKPWEIILKTWPQFFGLVALGLALGWAKRSARGILGLAIGLHAGLVWGFYLVNVGQLIRPTDRVPEWVTGMDGNPLAGLIGLGGVSAIAAWMAYNARNVRRLSTLPSEEEPTHTR